MMNNTTKSTLVLATIAASITGLSSTASAEDEPNSPKEFGPTY